MWEKQRKPSLPKEWSEDLWNDIFGSPWFRLIVDRYRFRSKTSDTTRALGEPGDVTDVSVAFQSDDTRPISHIEREYFGRLDHLDAVDPASGIPVTLSWNTDRQMIGAHEWWHWGTEQIPRKGVYGWVNPVQLDNGVRLGVILAPTVLVRHSSSGCSCDQRCLAPIRWSSMLE